MDRFLGYKRLTVVATRAFGAAGLVAASALFGASPAAASSSCGNVTPGLIKSTLGVVVETPTAVRNGPAVNCTYWQRSGSPVVVTIQPGMTPAKFKLERTSTAYRARTKTFSGLGHPAFSTVEGTGSTRSTGLVVLKGHTTLSVAWNGPLAKIAVLVKKVLPGV